MFETFTEEKRRPTYGLTKPVETYNLLKLEFGAYGKMIRQVRQAERWRHKLGYMGGPPGWEPPKDTARMDRPVSPTPTAT